MEPLDYALFRAHVYDEPNRLAAFLKGHLWVEQGLNTNLKAQFARPDAINIERESFARKVNLAAALGLRQYWCDSLIAMNTVRNRLAHDLHREVSPEDAKAIVNPLLQGLREGGVSEQFRDLEDALRDDPLDTLPGVFDLVVSALHLNSMTHEYRKVNASTLWGHDFLETVISATNESMGMSLDVENFRHVLSVRPAEPKPADVWVNKG